MYRQHVRPIEPLARRLARKPAMARASTAAAIEALADDREFVLDDIVDNIDAVRARAAQLVVAAASDAPWAVHLGLVRDCASLAVLVGFVAYAWAVLA